jgi:hypothetical protein
MKHLAGYLGALLFGGLAGAFLATQTSGPFSRDVTERMCRVLDALPTQSVVEYESDSRTGRNLTRYIEYNHPKARVLAYPGLLAIYLQEKYRHQPCSDKEFISEVIFLHNTSETIILNRWEDIPGFARQKLDADLGQIPQPFTPFTASLETGAYTVYTYTRLNGTVQRYRFTRSGQHLDCSAVGVLMQQVGGYQAEL